MLRVNQCNPNQIKYLIDFMRQNRDFGINNRTVKEPFNTDLWTTLTYELNKLGPPEKSIDKWRKTWADGKGKAKRKMKKGTRSQSELDFTKFIDNIIDIYQQAGIEPIKVHRQKPDKPKQKVIQAVHVNQIQKEYLIKIMNRHKWFVCSYKKPTFEINKVIWKKLSNQLNLRGPQNTVEKWRHVWSDCKTRSKKKKNQSRKLSNMELKVLEALDGVDEDDSKTVSDVEINLLMTDLTDHSDNDEDEDDMESDASTISMENDEQNDIDDKDSNTNDDNSDIDETIDNDAEDTSLNSIEIVKRKSRTEELEYLKKISNSMDEVKDSLKAMTTQLTRLADLNERKEKRELQKNSYNSNKKNGFKFDVYVETDED